MSESLHSIRTPALALDRAKLARNAAAMSARARELGVTLRPHLKTAKSVEVARVLTEGWDGGITVSTLAETAYFCRAGVRDILYGVVISPDKLGDARALVRDGCALTVLTDSVEGARAITALPADGAPPLDVLIEIDTDGHRGGVGPDEAALTEIADALRAARTGRLRGVLTHAGEAYALSGAEALAGHAELERSGAVRAADALRAAGHRIDVVSVGSTPTIRFARGLRGVTEARCGVYAFGDLVQAGIGSCAESDVALTVVATVIGWKPSAGRVILDAGFLALSRDRGTAGQAVDRHYGQVCDMDGRAIGDAHVTATNQEHGIVTSPSGTLDWARLPVGGRVRVLPNHACATAAAHNRYYVVDSGTDVTAVWDRRNGW